MAELMRKIKGDVQPRHSQKGIAELKMTFQKVRIFRIAQNIKTTLTIQGSRGKITFVRWSRQRLRSGMQGLGSGRKTKEKSC